MFRGFLTNHSGRRAPMAHLGAAALLSLCAGARAEVRYVNAAAPLGGDGASWGTAYRSLQAALSDAQSNPAVTEVWVAGGTYRPAASASGGRESTFSVRPGLRVLGGFAGTEVSSGDRDPSINLTVLSGDLAGDDLTDPFEPWLDAANAGDNCYHVVTLIGASAGTAIDGFTVMGGNADGAGADSRGAAIRIVGGAPTVSNCLLFGNRALTGGGAVVIENGAATIDSCRMNHNSAPGFSPDLGGGALGLSGATATVSRTTFFSNAAIRGGAAGIGPLSSASFAGCSFISNLAAEDGEGGAIASSGPITLVNCELAHNTIIKGSGGAIHHDAGSASAINCTIAGNSADFSGGGLYVAGGAFLVVNSIVHGNSAAIGTASQQQAQSAGGTITINRSIVEGGWSGAGGSGVLSATPLYVDPEGPDDQPGTLDDDLRLRPQSPGVDAGDNNALPPGVVTDRNGAPRRFDVPEVADSGVGLAPIVDFGAHEVSPRERHWANVLGGAFSTPENWFPLGTPSSIDTAVFDLNSDYSVSIGADATTGRVIVRSDTAYLQMNGRTWTLAGTAAASVVVGQDVGDAAHLTIDGGTLKGSSGRISDYPGSFGRVDVVGQSGFWSSSGSLSVGAAGDGHLEVAGGARVLARDMVLGDLPGSYGSALVRGIAGGSGVASSITTPFFIVVNNGRLGLAEGGRISATFGLFLFENGSLEGDGTITAPLINFGTVAPGEAGALGGTGSIVGELSIIGGYTQIGVNTELGEDSGSLMIDLAAGPDPGSVAADRLNSSGAAALAGGLFVSREPGTAFDAGDRFTILSAPSVGDSFDVSVLPPLEGGLYFRVEYPSELAGTESNEVELVVDQLPGDIALGDPETFELEGTPSAACTGDLNNDGRPDLAVVVPAASGGTGGALVVLMNLGNDLQGVWLGFGPPTVYPVGRDPSDVAIAPLDGDNLNDVVVTDAELDLVSFFRNTGGGALVLDGSFPVGQRPVSIAPGDMDGDGDIDLFVANFDEDTVSFLLNQQTVSLGGFNFADGGRRETLDGPSRVDPSDVDNDKDLDYVIGGRNVNAVGVHTNGGSTNTPGAGSFGAPPALYSVADEPEDVAATDINNDGKPDLVVGAGSGFISVLINAGTGQFAPSVNVPAGGGRPASVATLDLDGDGDQDLVAASRSALRSAAIDVFRNDQFVSGQLLLTVGDPESLDGEPLLARSHDLDGSGEDDDADVDGDGLPDIVLVSSPLDGPPTAGTQAAPPVIVIRSQSAAPCPGDVNANGAVDFDDLALVLTHFAQGPGGDADGDNDTDFDDLTLVLSFFGQGC